MDLLERYIWEGLNFWRGGGVFFFFLTDLGSCVITLFFFVSCRFLLFCFSPRGVFWGGVIWGGNEGEG